MTSDMACPQIAIQRIHWKTDPRVTRINTHSAHLTKNIILIDIYSKSVSRQESLAEADDGLHG